jgi:acrosin
LTGEDQGQHIVLADVFTFQGVENLTGNAQDDAFELNLGSLTGAADGQAGDDTLTAADVPTEFVVTSLDNGTATRVGQFLGIENLTGNTAADTFRLAGGELSGGVDGAGGSDTLIGDAGDNQFELTGVDMGTATGILGAAGFANIENLHGNLLADTLVVGVGSLSGTFRGEGGTDDAIEAADVENHFLTYGPNSGTVFEPLGPVRVGAFVGVESLIGNTRPDVFEFLLHPFHGTISGLGDSDMIVGGFLGYSFTISATDEGSVNGVTVFQEIESLTGGSDDDEFQLQSGGTLSGTIAGGSGVDTLIADSTVATTFDITGPDSGTLNGTTAIPFMEMENLSGGDQADEFVLNGGTVSGMVDGGGESDTLAADAGATLFQVTEADGGTADGVGSFMGVENLVGNAGTDIFWLDGGTLSGSVDGVGGSNYLILGDVPGEVTVDAANSGQATGIGDRFDNVQNLWGGTNADLFVVTATGSLDGMLFGAGGDDRFELTPGDALTFQVLGGSGEDQLQVDAQAGVPTVMPAVITIAPSGTTVNYSGIEDVIVVCDSCASPPASASLAGSDPDSQQSQGASDQRMEGQDSGIAHALTLAVLDGSLATVDDAGHFSSSAGLRIGYPDMLGRPLHPQWQAAQRRDALSIDQLFGQRQWYGQLMQKETPPQQEALELVQATLAVDDVFRQGVPTFRRPFGPRWS